MNEIERAGRAIENWHLGQTSARYESSGQGAGTISTGKGDHGGVSYGAYQLSSKMGTLNEYLHRSRYGEAFRGLTAESPAFSEKWRELARTDPEFAKDQHEFIGKSHYDEQLLSLNAAGISLAHRGRAVQDAVWSTSVQFRGLTPRIFAKGLAEKFGEDFELSSLTDSQIIEAVQDYKIAHNASLFKSSPEWQPSLLRRANNEKGDLLRLAAQEKLVGHTHQNPLIAQSASTIVSKEHNAHSTDRTKVEGQVQDVGHRIEHVRRVQSDLQQLGYGDPSGRPLTLDGIAGPNTIHAIKAFQHAHHLHVDGVIGPRTLAALEDAQHYPLLSEATNPHHHLYQQVFDGIHRLPHGQQPRGRELENATVALTMSAQQSGLHKVDHIVLGSYGVNLFAVQGRMDDPGHRRTHVELAHAAAHAVDHRSMSTVQYVPEHAHAMAVAQQQVEPRAPVMMGP